MGDCGVMDVRYQDGALRSQLAASGVRLRMQCGLRDLPTLAQPVAGTWLCRPKAAVPAAPLMRTDRSVGCSGPCAIPRSVLTSSARHVQGAGTAPAAPPTCFICLYVVTPPSAAPWAPSSSNR